jgi:hypothetical protein
MPLDLPDVSTATIFHLIGWFLLTYLVVELGWLLGTTLFGDPRRSPLDRGGTWIAHHLKNDDGEPLIKPWETPSFERKLVSSLYYVGVLAIVMYFAVAFLRVR